MFVSRVESASERRAVRENTIGASFSLSGNAQTGESSFSTHVGDEEDLRSLLLVFRSFMAPNEDVHASAIFNLIDQRVTDEAMRTTARSLRADWNSTMEGSVRVIANGETFTAKDCFDMRVNGELFHDDPVKKSKYDQLPGFLQGMVDQQMAALTIGGLQILAAVRDLVRQALDLDLIEDPGLP